MPQPALTIDDGLDEALRRPENALLRDFFAYWQGKRRNGRLPARSDIEPTEIPLLLPNIFLVDVVAGARPRFRFRLVGTMIVSMEFEMTNAYLDELVAGVDATPMGRQYLDATAGRVYLRRQRLDWRDRGYINYDVLLLPLADDGETINMLFGLVAYHRA
ncbi:MAG TPA: PAS domain-containing protein [Methylomirabilota bacterium]|nr:PAS domain-containing protein [Methylomirabilota bacterium]